MWFSLIGAWGLGIIGVLVFVAAIATPTTTIFQQLVVFLMYATSAILVGSGAIVHAIAVMQRQLREFQISWQSSQGRHQRKEREPDTETEKPAVDVAMQPNAAACPVDAETITGLSRGQPVSLASRAKGSRAALAAVVILVAGVVTSVLVITIGKEPGQNAVGGSTAVTASVKEVNTSKGIISVPGIAYADGTDPYAPRPLTVMNVNVWADSSRAKCIFQIRHGTEVAVVEVQDNVTDRRYYFKIQQGQQTGWLPESFLSPQHKPAIGDKIE